MKKTYRKWSTSDFLLIQKFRAEGRTPNEIARYFHVTRWALYSCCWRNGILLRDKSPDDLDDFQIMRIKDLRKKGWYLWEIAVDMALPEAWLIYRMQKIGLENFPKGARR